MKKILNQLTTKNAKTSAFFYFGSFVLNIGNYLFHLLLVRLLRPESYGEFLSYISFLYLITIPVGTISTLVTKHIAEYYGKNETDKINHFFYLTIKKIILPAIIMSAIIILSSSWLAKPLKAQPLAFIILGINIIFSFFGAILQSYLLAFQKFVYQTIVGFVDIISKISITYLFIINGWDAVGAVMGMFIASLISQTLIFLKIKSSIYPRIISQEQITIKMGSYTIYALLLSAGILALMSVDVLLVRYFFEPQASGLYSVLSVLGRIIFFGLSPLSSLLFPVVAKRYAAGQDTKSVLFKLGLAALCLGGIGVLIFTLQPDLIIRMLGMNMSDLQVYSDIKPWLPLYAVGMLCFALSQMLLVYFMSVGHQKATLIALAAIMIQPLAIGIFHNSLEQVVFVNLSIQVGLLLTLLGYYQVAARHVK